MKPFYLLSCAVLTLSAALAQSAQAGVLVTIEAPGVQSSTVSGVMTENFDTVANGHHTSLVSAIGTYSGAAQGFLVQNADQYGGAGNSGHYFVVGSQSGQQDATLALGQQRAYFGLWFSAGDTQNELDFYKGGSLIFSYNTGDVINFINGLSNKNAYYGNPNTGQDSGEPFAYLNFYGQGGTTFDSIGFHNNSLGTGFESDNHSVRTEEVHNPGGTPVTPEPGTWALLISGGMTGAGFLLRRKRACK